MTRLRVAVDATAIPSQRAGAGRYITELLRVVDPDEVELHVFVKDVDTEELRETLPGAEVHAASISGRPARIAWGRSVLPMRVRKLRPDVFFGPHYELPPGLPCPGVVTFHDPTFFTLPELHERKKVAYFRAASRGAVRRATRVIAPSAYAKLGAVEHARATPERVDVIHEGVDLQRHRPISTDLGSPVTDDHPYILFVGTLEPRKDVPTLIAAYDELDSPAELVLVGQPGWGFGSVESAISNAKKKTMIRRAGYVEEDEKIRLYQHASVFVYPAIAEGFGLPVLEAMACGAPVVTTTGSAPEEVADDAALLVPPQDKSALRDAISRVLTDDSLALALRKRGPERAKRFTWAAAAEATTDVWRRAAKERS